MTECRQPGSETNRPNAGFPNILFLFFSASQAARMFHLSLRKGNRARVEEEVRELSKRLMLSTDTFDLVLTGTELW